MKYQNKRNGKIATLLETNNKFKTVMLQPESMDDNNGKPYPITTSTFKRWWKKLDEDDAYVKEVMDQKKELGIEIPQLDPKDVEIVQDSDKCGDGTEFSQVMKEIEDGAKKRAKKATKKSVNSEVREKAFAEVREFLSSVPSITEIREWTRYSIAVKMFGKAFAEIRTVRSGAYTIYLKEDVANNLELQYGKINNYYLPAVIKNATLDTIETIFR